MRKWKQISIEEEGNRNSLNRIPIPRDERLKSTTGNNNILTTIIIFLLFILSLSIFSFDRHLGLNHRIEKPLNFKNQGLAVEHLVESFHVSESFLNQQESNKFRSIQEELDWRFSKMGLDIIHLPCTEIDDSIYGLLKHVDGKSTHGPYFIALNLFNSEKVIPSISRSLLLISQYLGVDNVHISIFENGSTDQTVFALAHFAASLTSARIRHTILSSKIVTEWKKVDRIKQLSIFRNLAIEPMKVGFVSDGDTVPTNYKSLIFLNDVYFCPTDTLELLLNKVEENLSGVCGLDWRKSAFGGIKFYDSWVSRTLSGEMLRPRFDLLGEFRNGIQELFQSDHDEEWYKRQSILVYSCWNGMIVLDTAPFLLSEGAVKFRSGKENECTASECKILAHSFWSLGFNRWKIIPSVRVTYDRELYSHPDLILLASNDVTKTNTDWNLIVTPKNVACYSYSRYFHLDLPFRKTYWPGISPVGINRDH